MMDSRSNGHSKWHLHLSMGGRIANILVLQKTFWSCYRKERVICTASDGAPKPTTVTELVSVQIRKYFRAHFQAAHWSGIYLQFMLKTMNRELWISSDALMDHQHAVFQHPVKSAEENEVSNYPSEAKKSSCSQKWSDSKCGCLNCVGDIPCQYWVLYLSSTN